MTSDMTSSFDFPECNFILSVKKASQEGQERKRVKSHPIPETDIANKEYCERKNVQEYCVWSFDCNWLFQVYILMLFKDMDSWICDGSDDVAH